MKVVSISKSKSAKNKQRRTSEHKVGKRGPKKGAIYLPPSEQLKIKRMWMDGDNILQIAKKTEHSWNTVCKIVRADDVQKEIGRLREKLYGQMDEILLNCVIEAKTRDANLGYRMLVDTGIMPQLGKKTVDMNVSNVPKETEDEIVHDIARELIEGAIERHKFFKMELPEFTEIEERLKQKKRETS